MLEKGGISPRQASLLIIAFLLGSAILTIPSATVAEARQDAVEALIIIVYDTSGYACRGRNPGFG